MLKAVARMLETTLGNMSASCADEIVKVCIKILKEVIKDETDS